MGTNSKAFIKELNLMQEQINDTVADVIKDSVLSAYENNLRPKQSGGAPRQTGWLRSNIYVTIDEEINNTTGSKESVSTSRRDSLANKFKSASTDSILSASNMYISYTVPYATAVNDGTSKQAGQHFAERSIQDISTTLQRKRQIK